MQDKDKAYVILKDCFGYESFRMQQQKAIENTLQKKDCLVLMPTGGGKSLCYQIPALIMDGIAIVLSPLIALMKDQVDALKMKGVQACFLNSLQTAKEQALIYEQIRNQKIDLLYVSPERLFYNDNQFLNFLSSIQISLFAIDEAHCISQWGYDFRPEYTKLRLLKEKFPKTPVLALTATADQVTKNDILDKLQLTSPQVYLSSFNRENIWYFVQPKQDRYKRLFSFLDRFPDESGIIYTLSRNSADSIAQKLVEKGYQAFSYHAGKTNKERSEIQENFVYDRIKIVVATIAFGMGIDKSNVRYVVHMDLPKNIECFYQETGRAGRDGLKSEVLLFYSYADVLKLKSFVEIEDNTKQSEIMLKKLKQMADFASSRKCRRQYLMQYFDESHNGNCNSCDICLNEYKQIDGTEISQMALSAVYRLKESFGFTYVINFLRGSQASTIKSYHKDIKTFGVGKNISKIFWQAYLRNLIDLDLLKLSDGEFPVLKLTPTSFAVLKGKQKVKLFLVEEVQKIIEKPASDIEINQDLFTQLKSLRTNLSKKLEVPPYLIFSDRALKEVSQNLPQSLEDLEKVNGFGKIKIQSYGKQVLEIVTKFL